MDLPDIDSLWDYQNPVASERAFQELLPLARRTPGEYLPQLLTQIARAQVLQRRYEDGHATLDGVVPLLSDDTPLAKVRYLLERGRAWNDAGRSTEARQAFEQAFEMAAAQGQDALAVDAAHMLGVMKQGDSAAAWNRRAIAIAMCSQDPRARRWIGTLFFNLGCNEQDLQNYVEAERAFEQAIRHHEESGNFERARLARLCLAKNRRLSGDPADALIELEPLHEQIRAASEPEGYAYEEKAECLLSLGRIDEAKKHFNRAYTLLSNYTWFPPNEVSRLNRMKELGGLGETGRAGRGGS